MNTGVPAAVLLELLYLFTRHLRLLKIKIKSLNSDGFSTGLVCTISGFFFIIKRLLYYTDKLISLSVIFPFAAYGSFSLAEVFADKILSWYGSAQHDSFWDSSMKVSVVLGKSLGDALSRMVKLCYSITFFV